MSSRFRLCLVLRFGFAGAGHGGAIAIVDLRLLGLASTKRPVAELSRQVLS